MPHRFFTLLLCLIFFQFAERAVAQDPFCDSFDAYTSCDGPIECNLLDLDGFTSCLFPESIGQASFCGGILQNPFFINFVAGSDFVEFSIEYNCVGPEFPSIQVAITDYCNPNSCYSDAPSVCYDGSGTLEVSGSGLQPNNVYTLLLDGCNDATCGFSVFVTDGGSFGLESPGPLQITQGESECPVLNNSVCPNSMVNIYPGIYESDELFYCWSIEQVNGYEILDTQIFCEESNDVNPCDSDVQTCGPLPIVFYEEGIYNICLDQINNDCETYTDRVCVELEVQNLQPIDFGTVVTCIGNIPYEVDVTGPNGEPWAGQEVNEGFTMTDNVNACGCLQTQSITIESTPLNTYYQDLDMDGYGNDNEILEACSLPVGYVTIGGDCLDFDDNFFPGAEEIPDNGLDEDCDGEDLTLDIDFDGDGFPISEDCDDEDSSISPNGTEVCDGIDNNCNGLIDEEYEVLLYVTYGEFNNTDGPFAFNYDFDKPDCEQIRLSMSVSSNGVGWAGPGNLELVDECSLGNPCEGNPFNSTQGDCNLCWDFMYASLSSNGIIYFEELLGDDETGPTDTVWQSQWIDTNQLGDEFLVSVFGQTWGEDENISFSNLMLVCYDDCEMCQECNDEDIATVELISENEVERLALCNETSTDDSCGENTVWFRVLSPESADELKIQVNGDFAPSICVYQNGCDGAERIRSNSTSLTFETEQIIEHHIGVGVQNGMPGNFEIEVSYAIDSLECIIGQSIQLVRPENPDLPQAGPFNAGETVRLCPKFKFISASIGEGNNCQWIQGIIPSLGTGWDEEGSNISVQSFEIRSIESQWFDAGTVDYNNENEFVGLNTNCRGGEYLDFMGSSLSPGELLPGGWWFTSDGTSSLCENNGDPDTMWGIPTNCGDTTSVEFCIDLKVRDHDDLSMVDECDRDLSLGIFVFADGETGCWTNTACVGSQPILYGGTLNTDIACPDPGTCNSDCTLGDLESWNEETCTCELILESVLGCTNPSACNFNPTATCDDGSCLFQVECNEDCLIGNIEQWNEETCDCEILVEVFTGCTDPNADNFDEQANCEDGSCLYDCPEYFVDTDGDGFGVSDDIVVLCEWEQGYAEVDGDCNDQDPNIFPGAIEIPNNGIDENCDGEDQTVVIDNDEDGFDESQDCDDENADVNPAAEEICDGIDNNCDGEIDEGLLITFYIDQDNDGFGNSTTENTGCFLPPDVATQGGDCDDTNPEIYPGAEEIPGNGIDENCDGADLPIVDNDGDGVGEGLDCDDTNPDVFPGAEELCDEIDNDCDGEIDEGLLIFFYPDNDGDGFGNSGSGTSDCMLPPDNVLIGGDCDDANPLINPDSEEIPNNNVDEDCDGVIVVIDQDGDGFNSDEDCDDTDADINPDAEDIPENGIDEDCDGEDAILDSNSNMITIDYELFPNPVSEVLVFNLESNISYNIEIRDIQGKIFLAERNQRNRIELDLQKLTQGVYVFTVSSNQLKVVIVERIVKI